MFDLLMTVLAYNAANAPVESVRSGAKDLMEKRMRSVSYTHLTLPTKA